MTYSEKRINKEDLGHFKEQQNEFTALIPGLNNLKTVGAAPLKRVKARETEMPGKLRMATSMGDLHNHTFNQSKTSGFGNQTLVD